MKIRKIKPSGPLLRPRKKVAAYARVSLESERLAHSLSAQVSYYGELIQGNPKWEYAGIYADSFISGTGTAKRAELQRLIADCEAERVDMTMSTILKKGDTGSAVATMQTMLIACGFSCGPDGADGDFGKNTLAGLTAFQNASGMEATGVYDADTNAALEKAYAALPVPVVGACDVSKVLAVAVAEIGYKEKANNSQLDDKTANAGSANYTKYARDFDKKYPNWYNGKKNGFAWCDMFVDWCFLTAYGYENALRLLCQPEKSAGAGCTYSLRYFKKKGQFHTSNPKPGDQIFFGTSLDNATHTGIVEKVTASKVNTIEGNTSNQVARRSYALSNSRILGYGRPAYDEVTETAPTPVVTPATDPEKTIWDTLMGFIGNACGVAGLMGNLYAESALNPKNLQNNGNKALSMTDDEFTAAMDSGAYDPCRPV